MSSSQPRGKKLPGDTQVASIKFRMQTAWSWVRQFWGTLEIRASTLSRLYEWAEPLAPRSLCPKGRRAGRFRNSMWLCFTTALKVMKP